MNYLFNLLGFVFDLKFLMGVFKVLVEGFKIKYCLEVFFMIYDWI